ncbi:MAG TPA: S8 family serine peptidase [Bacillales bacterium]|nr:S8 family serine peptidase [Bacillales bacterium]
MRKKAGLAATIIVVFSLFVSLIPRGVNVHAEEAGADIGPLLKTALETASEPLEVVVTFEGEGAPTDENMQLLKEIGITAGVTMRSLPIAGVLATPREIQALADRPDVRSLYLNHKLKYYNYKATELTGVDKVRTDGQMTKQNGGLPVSGNGVTVVVNDSGIDATHPDLKDNVVQNVLGTTNLHAYSDLLPITYTENVPNTDSNSGHGTHVAGTVAGTGAKSGGKYEGVAPGANLIGYGSGAALFILDAVGGFDYALTHQAEYGIRVITNSWGSTGEFDPDGPVNVASKAAYDHGIVVTFAAGNAGPGANTLNPYSVAPWVISVAAGDFNGKLADFSSRGVKGKQKTFTVDGEKWTADFRPTVTAPGVDIVSTRVVAPVSSLGATTDAETIEPAYLPYYTTMSGTSMATPHVAGIAALMLDANPKLSPAQVKEILQKTATNMPGYEPWEAGAGYVNAYAAVDGAFTDKDYGKTVNLYRDFNSTVDMSKTQRTFTVDYNPLTLASDNTYTFTVPEGLTSLTATVDAKGLLDATGNTINLVLTAPDGTEYSSGIYVAFPVYTSRTVKVNAPQPGKWTVELRGLRGAEDNPTDGAALPENVNGVLTFKTVDGYAGLKDIDGHPAEAAIKAGIAERLFDGYSSGNFKPNQPLSRIELAQYLVMGAEIRQSLPLPEAERFQDIDREHIPFVAAVTAKGAAMRDLFHVQKGVMLPTADRRFSPGEAVIRSGLAYSLVQSLGLQKEAVKRNDEPVTVQYKDQRIPIEDADSIPKELKGYVQLALDLNILHAYFTVTQEPYATEPTIHAYFKPEKQMTRGDFAVAMTRFYAAYLANE